MTATEISAGVQKLVDYRVDLPMQFQCKLLDRTTSRLSEQLKKAAADSDPAVCNQLLSTIGLWNAGSKTFDPLAPTLKSVAAPNPQKMVWMGINLFDHLLVPSVLAGESELHIVRWISIGFVRMFEEDGGLPLDDNCTSRLLAFLTACRCMKGLATNDIAQKAENIDEVISTWAERGSKKRSALSLIADAVDTTDYWRDRVHQIVANPTPWREDVPKLAHLLQTFPDDTVDLPAKVDFFRGACDMLVGYKANFPEEVLVEVFAKVWGGIQALWDQVKASMVTPGGGHQLTLAAVSEFLSYAQLAYPDSEKLTDMMSEVASMTLSRDGDERLAKLKGCLEACTALPDGAGLHTPDAAKCFKNLRAACDGAKGLKFDRLHGVITGFTERFEKELYNGIVDGVGVSNGMLQGLRSFESLGVQAASMRVPLDAHEACSDLQSLMTRGADWMGSEDGIPPEAVADDCDAMRTWYRAILKLRAAAAKLKPGDNNVKTHIENLLQETLDNYQALAERIIDGQIKEFGEQISKVEETGRTAGGKPWDDGIAASAPWQVLVDRYQETLGQLAFAEVDKDRKQLDAAKRKYINLCTSFGKEAHADILERARVALETVGVLVANMKLFGLILGTVARDKVKLRKAVLHELTELGRVETPETTTRLQKLLPSQLRVKVDKAIRMAAL